MANVERPRILTCWSPQPGAPGQRITDALMLLPYWFARETDPARFEGGENIRVADAYVVDLLLDAGGETYETVAQFAGAMDLNGRPIRTSNLEGLLQTIHGVVGGTIAQREVEYVQRAVSHILQPWAKSLRGLRIKQKSRAAGRSMGLTCVRSVA